MIRLILSLGLLLLVTESSCQQPQKEKTATAPAKKASLFPEGPLGWVSDFEKILLPHQVQYLDSIITKFARETKNEIAIVTLKLDPKDISSDEAFDSLSLSLFNTWGVGKDEKDNGIALLISASLRRTRIQVGSGLEDKLTNDEAQRIVDSILLTNFRSGNYFEGARLALQAIIRETK